MGLTAAASLSGVAAASGSVVAAAALVFVLAYLDISSAERLHDADISRGLRGAAVSLSLVFALIVVAHLAGSGVA